MTVQIRPYAPEDEQGWLRCPVELVAVRDDLVVGLIDVELEETPGTVCSTRPGLGAMIWHLAVHPDYRRRGIAGALLAEALRQLRERSVGRVHEFVLCERQVATP